MNYDTMTDRELDAAVDQRVMGRSVIPVYADEPPRELVGYEVWIAPGRHIPVGRYSTDIAEAWEVVEHFEVGFVQIDNGWRSEDRERSWTVQIKAPGETGEATAPTICRAICIAALKAMEAQA